MNIEQRFSCIKILVIIGFTFVSFSFTLAIATYSIPYWLTITNSTSNSSDWRDYSRSIGIFQECIINITGSLTIPSPYVIRNNCTDNDIGQYGVNSPDKYYSMIINMRQSQIGLHGATILLLLFTLFSGIGIFMKWCCGFMDSLFYIKWRNALGCLSLLSFLCFSASSAIGTAFQLIFTITTYSTTFLPLISFQKDTVSFGYMFYLAWAGCLSSLIASILFFISSQCGKSLEMSKYKPHIVSIDNPSFNSDEYKIAEPIFLQPTIGRNDFSNLSLTANVNNPGPLPRYNINLN